MGAGQAGGECEEQTCGSKEEYQVYNPLYNDWCRGWQQESFCFRLRCPILYAGPPSLYRRIFHFVSSLKSGGV